MTLRPMLLSLACAALALATGCRGVVGGSCHKPQAYADAGNLPSLRMPAGLDGPDTSEALEVPPLNEPEVKLDPDGPCLEAPPAIVAPPLPPSLIELPSPGARRREAPPRTPEEAAEPAESEREEGSRSPRRPPRPR